MPVYSLTRVSTDSAGLQQATASNNANISDDGTKVVFNSGSATLVTGDTNGFFDIFVKTLATGQVVRVSTDSAGVEGNANVFAGSDFTPDGTRVVFMSTATNLVGGADNNGVAGDVFMKNLNTGATTRLSETQAGVGADASASFSAGGAANGFVVFQSGATNLVAGDTNGFLDVFRKNLTDGSIARVSLAADGTTQGNSSSTTATVSADGRYVAFVSSATNLVAGDANGQNDVFVKDMTTGAVTLVSVAADGTTQGDSLSSEAQISADGTKVVFQSSATNLVAGDANGQTDIFVKTLATGAIQRVSVSAAGTEANGVSQAPAFSPDGRYVVFMSAASNLAAGDTNGINDVFVKDLDTGAVTLASATPGGVQPSGGGTSARVDLSSNGRVVFDYTATNLVADDTNGVQDVFLADIQAPAATPTVPDPVDNILGGDGNDTIVSGEGDDQVRGWEGSDSLSGQTGRDTLVGWNGDDTIHGGEDNDSVTGDAGNDMLQGNQGADNLEGGGGNDTLYGGKDSDTVSGGDGDDRVFGDQGNDLLWGGAGADRFVFGAATGGDWIADFSFAQGDRIELPTGTAYSVSTYMGQTVLTLAGGAQIGLAGVSGFSADWIVFA